MRFRRPAAAVVTVLLASATGAALAAERPKAEARADAVSGRAAQAGVKLVRVGRFARPTHVTAPAGERDRAFVVQKGGTIKVIRRGRILKQPFLDLRRSVSTGGEQGLLSMAFAPDYARTRRFYVYFTDRGGDIRVWELRRSRGSADRSTARTVIRVEHSKRPNHNGGQVAFGPDGLLYLGTGDGGGTGDPDRNAQNRDALLGKLLRIDPRRNGSRRYTVPADNPFVGRDGANEVYALGLRNPYRFSFDRATGDLALGDVGQQAAEEIDFTRAGGARGANFGWNCFEGTRRYSTCEVPDQVRPVLEYSHAGGRCSVTGGHVVRDPALGSLAGRYVYGDFCAGRLVTTRLAEGGASLPASLGLRVPDLNSFGEDGRGRVYATSLGGAVYRLAPR